MEKVIDFDEWLKNYKPQDPVFVAVFDPVTGEVESVGPDHAFKNIENKIVIDTETALRIIDGEIRISNCVIDVESETLEIAEIKNLFKIDDVLHRVIDKDFFDEEKFDLYLTYNKKTKKLKFELSKDLGGTKKPKKASVKRKVLWDGNTSMKFLITDYNDPNVVHQVISIQVLELIGNYKTVDINFSSDFSVYTKRLFKNYVIEKK